MIDFACKRFDLKEVIKCSLGLTKADLKVFDHLMRRPREELTTEALSASLGLDLSTVQRSVKRLRERGLALQAQRNLSGGGYEYAYRVADRKAIKGIVMGIVSQWTARVEEEFCAWGKPS